MKKIVDHEFVARGELYKDNLFVPITFRGSYSEFEHKQVKCVVLPDVSEQGFAPFFENHELKYLKGVAQDGENIWISALTFISSTHTSRGSYYWEGIAETFIKGDLDEFDPSGGKIYCQLFIPPTPLALTHGYILDARDGTIRFENSKAKRKGICWNTKYGIVELIDGFSYADHQVGLNESIVRIRRCMLSFKVKTMVSISLADILRDCAETFDDTLWLISFLSRKRLSWYSGNALFVPSKGSKAPFHHAIICRDRHLGYENAMGYGKNVSDLFVSPDKLKQGLFQQLLQNYEKSKYKEIIRQAIIYLLITYERGYIETDIGISYLALETLVSGIFPDLQGDISDLLSKDKFNSLATQLEKVIRENTLNPEITQKMIGRFGKLNHAKSATLAERAIVILDAYKVGWINLWPKNAEVITELSRIIDRRNEYIHEGRINNYDAYLYDFARIRHLVELLILKLLDCPDDSIDMRALMNFMPINQV